MSWREHLHLGWTWFFKWTGYKQMKLTLTRLDVTDKGIFGHMVADAGSFDCVTLERHDVAIPCGIYKITLYDSPTHGLVPLLHDVPKRSMIEIHEGNWEKNSKGCILVGMKRDGFAIDTSRPVLKRLVDLMKGVNDIWITVK